MRRSGIGRAMCLAAVSLLAVVACAEDADDSAAPGTSSSSAASPEQTSTVPGETPAEASTPTVFEPPGDGPPPTEGPSGGQPPETTAGPGPVGVPSEGPVGSYGPWYLGRNAAGAIVVEVRSQSGAEPSASTVDAIVAVLADVSGKQVTTSGGEIPGDSRTWTPGDIRTEADRVGPAQRPEAAVLTLLFVRGRLQGADQTIGVAVRSDVAAIFSDKVDEAAGPLVGTQRIEQAVTTHEVGHLLGLVDLVLDTGRDDPEHPGHSTNRGSVMYFAVESTLVGDLLSGGPPTSFDAADRADLQTIARR